MIWTNHCPGGFIDGTWHQDNSNLHEGSFEGLWYERNGEPFGIMTCQYWRNNDGRGEFHGYLSGYITDQIIAEIKGRWYYDDYSLCPMCGSGHGKFHGRFEFMDRDGWGYFGGTFGWGTSVDALELPLEGYWKMHCLGISSNVNWN